MGVRPEYVTDGAQWIELHNNYATSGGNQPNYPQELIDAYRNGNDPLLYPNTDWIDVMAGDRAPMTSHTLTISGGNETNKIRTTFNYLNQDGIGLNNQQERYSIRINNENKISKNLNLGFNLSLSASDIIPPLRDYQNYDALGLENTPHIPVIQAPDGR